LSKVTKRRTGAVTDVDILVIVILQRKYLDISRRYQGHLTVDTISKLAGFAEADFQIRLPGNVLRFFKPNRQIEANESTEKK